MPKDVKEQGHTQGLFRTVSEDIHLEGPLELSTSKVYTRTLRAQMTECAPYTVTGLLFCVHDLLIPGAFIRL